MKNYIIVILDKMNGLTNEIKAAKEYLDCGQNKKCTRVDWWLTQHFASLGLHQMLLFMTLQ